MLHKQVLWTRLESDFRAIAGKALRGAEHLGDFGTPLGIGSKSHQPTSEGAGWLNLLCSKESRVAHAVSSLRIRQRKCSCTRVFRLLPYFREKDLR